MTTIKIEPCHPSQGEFVLIEKTDFDPSKHELLEGESLGAEGRGDRVPTVAELLAARADLLAEHDNLQQRERELAAEKERVAKQAHENELAAARNAEQATANEAEAQRLRDEAASLQAAKDAAAAASLATSSEKPVKAAKA